MKTKDATVWEVTNQASQPVMYCSYAREGGLDAEYATIRAVLNRAKKDGVSVVSIALNLDEEAEPVVTLAGTRDDS